MMSAGAGGDAGAGVGADAGRCGLDGHVGMDRLGLRGGPTRAQGHSSGNAPCATLPIADCADSSATVAVQRRLSLRCPLCLEELPPRRRPRLAKRYKGARGLSTHVEKMHAEDARSKGDALVALVAAEEERVRTAGQAPAQFRNDGRIIHVGGSSGTGAGQAQWMSAACEGRVDGPFGLRQLVTTGVHNPDRDVDKHGYTSLCWAAGSDQVEAVEFLASCAATARAGGCTPASGTARRFASLMELVHPMGSEGRTPLHWAARNGSIGVVRYVLQLAHAAGAAGPLPEGTEDGGRAAISAVPTCGCADSAEVQRARAWTRNALGQKDPAVCVWPGVVDARTSCDGTTPLHLACYGGHIGVAQLLVAAGANPFHRNDYWCSCAHWTCMGGSTGCVDVLKWLVASEIATVAPGSRGGDSRGAGSPPVRPVCGTVVQFDERQQAGVTALHKAAVKGAVGAVSFLLQHLSASSVAMRDASGYTAEDLARCGGHAGVVAAFAARASKCDGGAAAPADAATGCGTPGPATAEPSR